MMKHITYLCLLLILAGCSQTEIGDQVQGVSFSADIKSDSRATDLGFEAGDQISVFAVNAADNSLLGNNVKYTYNNGFVAAGVPVYYPADGTPLSFYAVYPYGVPTLGEVNFTVARDQSSRTQYDKSNLMTAVTEPTTELVPHLQFKHQMANLMFMIQNDCPVFEVTGVHFCNLATTMVYDVLNDEVLALENFNNVIPRFLDGSYMVLCPPQTIGLNVDFIQITGFFDGNSVSFPIKMSRDTDFRAGFRYEYTMYVDKDGYYYIK